MLPRQLWPEKRPQRLVPVVALHGTEDQALAFESAKSTYAHLNNLGIPVEFRRYEGEKHKLSDRMYRDWSLALAQMLQN
jgi:dipeptidyl aminopeptidase/acylaminoacyl peptidase